MDHMMGQPYSKYSKVFERQRKLAERGAYFQGLHMVPIGAFMLFQAAIAARWVRADEVLTMALLIATFALFATIQATYLRFHGWPSLTVRPWYLVRTSGFGLLVVAVGGAAAAWDVYAPAAISMTGVAIAGMVAVFWLAWGTAHRLHYAIMSLLVLASSVSPLTGLAEPEMYLGTPLMYAVFGIIMVSGGILDHAMLLRMRANARLEG